MALSRLLENPLVFEDTLTQVIVEAATGGVL